MSQRHTPLPPNGADYDRWFTTIETLVMHHSPSGVETEIDRWLLAEFAALGLEVWQDEAGNVIAKIAGKQADRAIAITAHKDEIGAIVKQVEDNGRVILRKLGGAFPWVYGEGAIDLLGDHGTLTGILSFGSRHVSHASPQKAQQTDHPVTWEDAWVETKCSAEELAAIGIRPGTRAVVGKHRKAPLRLKDWIASYTLDNKASLAILLELARTIRTPEVSVYLVASAKEEIGAIGALYFSNRTRLEALIALEICPLSVEYPINDGDQPVLVTQDGYGVYDEGLNQDLRTTAAAIDLPLQLVLLDGFGSDASIAMKFGHVARAACLSFPTQNTHGYEIAHLGAIAHCAKLLTAYCQSSKNFS
jgi:putative aminopeptidase FrvX